MVNSPGLLVHISALLPSLSPAERRVARLVVSDPADAAGHTITDLASAAETSEATVIRFCRSVGITGYPQLRLRLAAEAAEAATRDRSTDDRVAGGEIPPDADLARIVATIGFNEARSIEETAAQLDLAVCERVVDAVDGAGRIEVHGAGSSGCAALELQQKLHRIGRCVAYWPDPQAALASTALLGPGDVAIGISHSGTSVGALNVLAQARLRGAVTVAVTNFPRSPLAGLADLVLTTAVRETTYRAGAFAGRLAQLMVVDCLFVGVAVRNRKRAGQALAAADEAIASPRAPGVRGKAR